MARWTVAGSLAHGIRPKPQSRSQLRVSVGLAPTSPVPEPASRDRTQHPGCAQPLSREHPRDVTSAVQTRAATVDPQAAPARASVATWHAGVWLVWALAAAACVQLATSPVYVALVIGIAALAVSAHARPGPYARAFPVLVTVGVVFAVVRMLLTVATTHGLGTVLFSTPHFMLPQLLGGFTVGGTVELPVILQSLAEGFAIVGMMAVFGAFNGVVTHSELVQSTPRAFYEVGLVVVVALAFVPSTLAAIGDVRDADRARTGGRVVRRGRLLRQIVPILELGMERAVTLSESMDARGFACRRRTTRSRRRLVGCRVVARARRCVRRADRRAPHPGRAARSRRRDRARRSGDARVVGSEACSIPAAPHDEGRLDGGGRGPRSSRRACDVLDRR